MLEFFHDLAKLTPVQHLIEYRFFWTSYVALNFTILLITSRARRYKKLNQ